MAVHCHTGKSHDAGNIREFEEDVISAFFLFLTVWRKSVEDCKPRRWKDGQSDNTWLSENGCGESAYEKKKTL